METSIPEIYNGVDNAMSTIAAVNPFLQYLYALVAIVSFIWIIIDFRGTVALVGHLRTHFFTLFFVWLFFGGGITSDVTLTLNQPNSNGQNKTYSMPVGFKYTTAVIHMVTGWASGAIGKMSLNNLKIDVSKMPFAAEIYTMKSAKIEQMIAEAVKDPAFANKKKFYQDYCLDAGKLKTNPPKLSFQLYLSAYVRDNPPPNPQCNDTGSWLYDKANSTVQDIAKKTNMTVDDVARIAPKNWLQRQVEKLNPENLVIGLAEAIMSVFLRVVSVITYATAFIYAKALPFFLGILNQMYVAVFPLIVAMAMLPGRWMSIVTYFEGYLWLVFMPVVVAAVDGFSMQLTDITTDLLSLPHTMLMLAKLSIVLSVPAITSFLLFGQRTYRVGPSDVAKVAAGGAVRMVTKAASLASGPSGKRPGGGGPGTVPAGNILGGGGGWGGGNVVASTGGRGQPPVGTPVTTAASNFDMNKENSEAFGNALAAVTEDRSSSSPDYVSAQRVSGNIKGGRNGGELGGALSSIPQGMLETGVVAQVRDSQSGAWNSVHMQAGADGRVSFSKPQGGTDADGAMAAKLNSGGKGEIWAAKTVVDGHKFTYLPGGGANVAKLRWGNQMSSENLVGGDLYDFVSKQEKKFV